MIEGPVYLCHLRPFRHAVVVGVSVLLKHPDAGDEVQYATCSFNAAQGTLAGIELMHMIKKKQLLVETGDEGLTAAELFYALAVHRGYQGEIIPEIVQE